MTGIEYNTTCGNRRGMIDSGKPVECDSHLSYNYKEVHVEVLDPYSARCTSLKRATAQGFSPGTDSIHIDNGIIYSFGDKPDSIICLCNEAVHTIPTLTKVPFPFEKK